MELSSLLTPEARAGLIEWRTARYIDAAADHLEQTFPDDPCLETHEIRESFARACHERAKALGFTARTDHLRYLTHSVFLGLAFDANPLFAREMLRTGWIDPSGARRSAFSPADFDHVVSIWTELGRLDCAEPARLIGAARSNIDAWARIRTPRSPAAFGEARDQLVWALSEVWRDRAGWAGRQAMANFADTALRHAVAQGLWGGMIPLYATLAMHLGLYFGADPRYGALALQFSAENVPPDGLGPLEAAGVEVEALLARYKEALNV